MKRKEVAIFLRYIMNSRLLTKEQRSRRDRLLSRDYMVIAKDTQPDPEAVYLLEIWEKEGLDAAVLAWKNGDYKKKEKEEKKRKRFGNPKPQPAPDAHGISPEDFEKLNGEVARGGGNDWEIPKDALEGWNPDNMPTKEDLDDSEPIMIIKWKST